MGDRDKYNATNDQVFHSAMYRAVEGQPRPPKRPEELGLH